MAEFKGTGKVEFEVVLVLSEEEARAIDAFCGYDTSKTINVFYEHLGEYYLKPHEKGLRSFMDTARQALSGHIARCDAAREAFQGKTEAKG